MMKALVLAAGQSQRVQPIPDKNLIRFCGKTLFRHQLERWVEAGLRHFIFVVGAHNRYAIEAEWENVQKSSPEALQGHFVVQNETLPGMAGALLSAKEHLQGEVLVLSTNDWLEKKAYQGLFESVATQPDHALLAYQTKSYFPGGYLKLEGDSLNIQGIVEKPGAGKEPSPWVNVVLHYHKEVEKLFEILETFEGALPDDAYEQALDARFKTATAVAVPYDGFWQAIKYPWHALAMMEGFLQEMPAFVSPEAEIAETAVLKGKVFVEAGVKIMDYAVINGPVYLGKGALVGNHALVRSSMIGEKSVVGTFSEVARSLVGSDTWFHSNYIGDSVIGDNVSFGAGALTANLRLDEAEIAESGRNKLGLITGNHIRIGVQTCLMPGVRVGSNSMIGSGLVIEKDIPKNSFVKGTGNQVEIRENKSDVERLKR